MIILVCNYKTVKDSLGLHLDEISVLHKSRVRSSKKAIAPDICQKENFEFPGELRSMVYVCYNQKDSVYAC